MKFKKTHKFIALALTAAMAFGGLNASAGSARVFAEGSEAKTTLTQEEAKEIVDEYNANLGVSKEQAEAMRAGSMFGFHVPAADPKTAKLLRRFSSTSPSPRKRKNPRTNGQCRSFS